MPINVAKQFDIMLRRIGIILKREVIIIAQSQTYKLSNGLVRDVEDKDTAAFMVYGMDIMRMGQPIRYFDFRNCFKWDGKEIVDMFHII